MAKQSKMAFRIWRILTILWAAAVVLSVWVGKTSQRVGSEGDFGDAWLSVLLLIVVPSAVLYFFLKACAWVFGIFRRDN